MPQRWIAELCNLQKPTVSQHLKALCESGYALQYHIPGNQRCKMIAVTQRGKAELERMNALLKQDLEKRFSKDELHRINHALQGLCSYFTPAQSEEENKEERR